MAAGELACSCTSLILHDDSIPITAEKILMLAESANVSVETYWPSLFAKLFKKRNVKYLNLSVGSGGGGAPMAVSAPVASANATSHAAEEKKEEPNEESDEDMGFSLFD